jgi:hypothetical protein
MSTRNLVRPNVGVLLFLSLVVLGAVPSRADHPEGATPADLRELRTEVARLDDRLAMLEDGQPRAREFRQREQTIRDRLVVLRDEIHLHHQDEDQGLGASKAEVADLRREIRSLSDDLDAAFDEPAPGRGRRLDVPDGTRIKVRLEEGLSSRTARVEDRVVATVAESVRHDGRMAIPAGTAVRGTVERAERAERPSRGGRLEMSFDSLVVDGQRLNMDARVVQIEESGLDKSKAGLGALIGGVVGAVVDGKKGALIGAIVGGGGTVVASSGDEVELPPGTVLTVELERPLVLTRR